MRKIQTARNSSTRFNLKLSQLELRISSTICSLNIYSLVLYYEVRHASSTAVWFVSCGTSRDAQEAHAARRLLQVRNLPHSFFVLDKQHGCGQRCNHSISSKVSFNSQRYWNIFLLSSNLFVVTFLIINSDSHSLFY